MPSRFAVLDLDDEHCSGCGEVLGLLDSVYCGKVACQEAKRSVTRDAPGVFPKEKLLAMLQGDLEAVARFGDGASDVMLLISEVRNHPWNDCSTFLMKRTALLERCKNVPARFPSTLPEKYTDFGKYGGAVGPIALPLIPPKYAGIIPKTRIEQFISFGPTSVFARDTVAFQSVPQCCLRLDRLIIPSDVGQHFDIYDLRVGNMSACSTPIPASAFSELAIGINLGLPELMVGMTLMLAVSNKTDESRTFSAGFIGSTMQ